MKFCPECGNPVEGYKFCPNCGYSIANQDQTEQPQPVNKPASPSPTARSRKTDKVGPLEIDRYNRTYRIHGAQKAKGLYCACPQPQSSPPLSKSGWHERSYRLDCQSVLLLGKACHRETVP